MRQTSGISTISAQANRLSSDNLIINLDEGTMLGEVKEKNALLPDLSWREIAVFAPLIAWAFWIGLNPQPYFRVLERPVAQIVERVRPGYYAERHLPNPLEGGAPTAAVR